MKQLEDQESSDMKLDVMIEIINIDKEEWKTNKDIIC